MRTYTFISDPGHGWLKVPFDDVKAAGILADITDYSYVSNCGRFLFLEEDCDAGRFIDVVGRENMEITYVEGSRPNGPHLSNAATRRTYGIPPYNGYWGRF